ncbi:cobalamin B12-binding domain-containing protein [Rhodococcus sp. 14-2470-1a]|uniref:cobalamin B12-binding domain-containing protein n=1 Tax=Rhodococcus sp. 14-2470-1a TaxID=2023150 RepID=UPI000B9C5DA8|nr:MULTISPECIES: cobalamin-dependent protein [unclassified Rhodococcus (in: high G+C Gram-positive bacteria)]OZD59815.1 hypothetical protein CH263_22245 [Rhodococcus sp. 06-1059B-a]OZF56624.1 hypothetical protein CH292_03050 [Rhodococcus sp. 14-2470-1a]
MTTVDDRIRHVGDSDSANSRETIVVSGVTSDSHTWNLVFLQLLVEEEGFDVINLGPCTPEDVLVSACAEHAPSMVVMSSVNGHGYHDGMRMIKTVRENFGARELPVVIGGKLGITGASNSTLSSELTSAGFTAVFDDSADGLAEFRGLLGSLASIAA